jgi:hypothetical protein
VRGQRREVEEAAVDCKSITTQTIVTLPFPLKAGKEIRVKNSVF